MATPFFADDWQTLSKEDLASCRAKIGRIYRYYSSLFDIYICSCFKPKFGKPVDQDLIILSKCFWEEKPPSFEFYRDQLGPRLEKIRDFKVPKQPTPTDCDKSLAEVPAQSTSTSDQIEEKISIGHPPPTEKEDPEDRPFIPTQHG